MIRRLTHKINLLVQLLRAKQWTKNLFIFAAIVFSSNIFVLHKLYLIVACFILFCLLASGIYILNDLSDRKFDQHHPVKSKRLIASGAIKPTNVLILGVFLTLLSIYLSFSINAKVGMVFIIYALIHILYSLYLKSVVILDVFCVASGFMLRVLAGALAIDVKLSSWIIICTILISLFLSFTKRRGDLIFQEEGHSIKRMGAEDYTKEFLDQAISISAAGSIISYCIYTISEETIRKFGTLNLMYTIPFVLFGIFRYLYLIYGQQKAKSSDPTDSLLADRFILTDVFLYTLVVVYILYK